MMDNVTFTKTWATCAAVLSVWGVFALGFRAALLFLSRRKLNHRKGRISR